MFLRIFRIIPLAAIFCLVLAAQRQPTNPQKKSTQQPATNPGLDQTIEGGSSSAKATDNAAEVKESVDALHSLVYKASIVVIVAFVFFLAVVTIAILTLRARVGDCATTAQLAPLATTAQLAPLATADRVQQLLDTAAELRHAVTELGNNLTRSSAELQGAVNGLSAALTAVRSTNEAVLGLTLNRLAPGTPQISALEPAVLPPAGGDVVLTTWPAAAYGSVRVYWSRRLIPMTA